MKNKNVRGILALIIVTALSFGVIAGSRALAKEQGTDQSQGQAQVTEELDVSGAENIQSAAKTREGYLVTVKEAGYGGDIVMEVSFGEDKSTVTGVQVTEQSETEGVGSRITEEEFLSQFAGAKAPVYLPGMTLETEEEAETAQAEDLELQDGTYEAKADGPDNNGYTDQVTITVADGKITEAVWESVDGDGNKKSEQSENGQYVMTEDGPTWAEQSKALGQALVENQSLGFLTMDNQGKTDAVSGVSISVGGFADLAQKCIDQAAGKTEVVLQDGTYEAKADGPDNNGYTDQVTITVADGKITDAVWESVDSDGNKKSEQSENGQYVMTEDGPTWAEQSKALGQALVENQSLGFLTMDNQGKTDAVSGVSISVGGFADLAQKCIDQAAGKTEVVLQDGTYEAKADGPDNNGYTDQVTITVADGKITDAVWESVDSDGNKKSEQSENGQYVMTEDGPTWAEQSKALGQALVENQSLGFLTMDNQGKTDAVSGVSISVGGFADLAQQCIDQAAGVETEEEAPQEGTQVDGISGATISSTAAVNGINAAYEFLQTID